MEGHAWTSDSDLSFPALAMTVRWTNCIMVDRPQLKGTPKCVQAHRAIEFQCFMVGEICAVGRV
jgi:hypothetical protein